MPADLIKRINPDLLYAPFFEKVLDVLAACRARGADYFVTYGYRTYAESNGLWMLYATKKGPRAAPAGKSAHNFGLAVDVTYDLFPQKPGLQPSWDSTKYDILGEEVAKAGLHWGASYRDRPHVGWPGYVSAKDLAPLDKAYRATPGDVLTKLKEVWKLVK